MYSSMDTGGYPSELPHSVISGSQTMCVYPELIAAYHDLLRLLMPRHSPCTLYSLIFKLLFYFNSIEMVFSLLSLICSFQRTLKVTSSVEPKGLQERVLSKLNRTRIVSK